MKHLVTPRLLMRPYISGDYADFHTFCNEVGIAGGGIQSLPVSPEQSRQLLDDLIVDFAEHGFGMFALIERKEKRFIGQCGLILSNSNAIPELSFGLLPYARGKGYATEACMQVLRVAKAEFAIERVKAFSPKNDSALIRVFRKIGMTTIPTPKEAENRGSSYIFTPPKKFVDSLFESTYLAQPKITALRL